MASGEKQTFGTGWVAAAVILSIFAAVSCSKPEPKKKPENTNTVRPQNAAEAPPPVNSNVSVPPGNTYVPANVEYFENDATNRIGKGSTLDRARRRQRVDADPNASPVPPTLSPAPENSEGAITMLPDGTVSEIRIFKAHPTLLRVDTYFLKPGTKRVKFTFKDGNVIELESDKIDNLLNMPAARLLQIAGVK
ncbi:MAG: hypothetical protein IPM50_14960 [Acidobacteriota bacterium]|nr:MAG: hypothetical protein IPM50_14960 [Acidobacteriota bacterium]